MSISEIVARLRTTANRIGPNGVDKYGHRNVVHDAVAPESVTANLALAGVADHPEMHELYLACDGMDFVSIWNGFFLRRVDWLCGRYDDFPVTQVIGSIDGPVVVIGSDGGGALFAYRTSQRDVLFLSFGAIRSGVFDGRGRMSTVTIVGESLAAFLARLLADSDAFLDEKSGHEFWDGGRT